MNRYAVYPGTFDPFTNGHLDIVARVHGLFERVVVAVANNRSKAPLFTMEERVALIREAVSSFPSVEVDSFDGLLVDYATNKGAKVIIRGLRAVSDYEYELQMALMNRRLNDEIETFFMAPSTEFSFLSSGLVKEVALHGGDVSKLVPACVQAVLAEKLSGGPGS
ncbi:MAG: pantetheine-phosphate adenylyltransferase [Nitrospinota bacterium]